MNQLDSPSLLESQEMDEQLRAQVFTLQQFALIGQLVSGVGHELNNYLSIVLGFAGMSLKRKGLDPRLQQDLEKIHDQAQRAATLVSQLLNLARQGRSEKQYCEVNSLLKQCLALRAYDLKCNNVAAVLDLQPLPMLLANPQQLQGAFLNIMMNAEQAIARSGRAGRIAMATRYTPGLHDGQGHVHVTFQDNGLAIPERFRSHAFDGMMVSNESERSVGLYLNIARTWIEVQQGSISVESDDEAGTLFMLKFPCQGAAVSDVLVPS